MKIVSGGQTGADRAAVDFALEHGIAAGGWIPKGRLAEDGPIPDHYTIFKETVSTAYPERTKQNVIDSDGTLILSNGEPLGGTLLTLNIAGNLKKPYLLIDFQSTFFPEAANLVRNWVKSNRIATLNVAGPRASHDSTIYNATKALLTLIFD